MSSCRFVEEASFAFPSDSRTNEEVEFELGIFAKEKSPLSTSRPNPSQPGPLLSSSSPPSLHRTMTSVTHTTDTAQPIAVLVALLDSVAQ